MSKTALLVGLGVSLAVHAWLLGWEPASEGVAAQPTPESVEVVALAPPLPTSIDQNPTPVAQETNPVKASIEPASTPCHSSINEHGDFAGSTEGERSATLRIDWGDTHEAQAVLKAGRMKLVVYDPDANQPVLGQVERDGSSWQIVPVRWPEGVAYSNRVRMVNRVPGFESIARALRLRSNQNLAVFVPQQVERMMRSEQLAATFQRGMQAEQVRAIGGRFTLSQAMALGFEITHVQSRRTGR